MVEGEDSNMLPNVDLKVDAMLCREDSISFAFCSSYTKHARRARRASGNQLALKSTSAKSDLDSHVVEDLVSSTKYFHDLEQKNTLALSLRRVSFLSKLLSGMSARHNACNATEGVHHLELFTPSP